ncbi:MAG TPA: DivIVA domain-containing protein [Solirubrobacteraceae bacterium]|nr:DivIVA domain-containing protein [Solirubrobacteraceae bacterium]
MPDQSYAATEHALLEEIARPLDRLPDDPLELVQTDFPTAMRGYDKAAVDEYVRETSQLVAELQAVRSPESAVRRALVRAGGQISGVLRRAHETAAEITAQSRSEAEDRLERARAEAEELMDAAERRVRDLDADTDRIWLDRQRIMADVEDLSNQLLGLAKQAGERFPDDDQVPYDDESAERSVSGDVQVQDEAEEQPEREAGDEAGSETWTPVESAARDESIVRERPGPHEMPAAWERWADHEPPAGETGERTGSGSALTDRSETLPLATPGQCDVSEPPEVEPRSARLSHEPPSEGERASEDDRDAGRGSDRVIPPMSDAANRPRPS